MDHFPSTVSGGFDASGASPAAAPHGRLGAALVEVDRDRPARGSERHDERVILDTLYFEVGDADAVDRAVEFYTRNFGLEVSSAEAGESAWLKAGDLTLGFHIGDAPSNPWAFNLGFSVPDVDAACADLESKGVSLSIAPYDAPWGRAASLADPNGFTIWLTQR